MISYTLLEFDELPSTSDLLKENKSYFPHLTIVRADYQTKGRGQFDRSWESDKKANILCSILLKQLTKDALNQVKPWVLTALVDTMQHYGIMPTFKEPNDLYVDKAKIAGILIESISHEEIFESVIIGIGLNVNQGNFSAPHATSFMKIKKQVFDVAEVFTLLIQSLLKTYPF